MSSSTRGAASGARARVSSVYDDGRVKEAARHPAVLRVLYGALRIVRRRGRDLFGPVLFTLLAVPFAFSLVGIPAFPWILGLAVFLSTGRKALRPEQISVGIVAALAIVPSVGAFFVGLRIEETAPYSAYPAVGCFVVLVAAVGTAAVTPLIGTAASLARCGGTVSDALARSLLRCAQLGPASPALGAVCGAALVLPWAFVPGLFAELIHGTLQQPWGWLVGVGFLAAAVGAIAGPVVALAVGAAIGEPALHLDAAPSPIRVVAVPTVVALVATLAAALLVPSPMATPVDLDAIERARNIRVRTRDHTVADVTLDDRYLGAVRAAPDHAVDWQDGDFPIESGRIGDAYVVAAWGPAWEQRSWIGALYDDEGNRVDDGPTDRIRARFGLAAACALALASMFAVWVRVRASASARHADGPVVIDAIVRGNATRLEALDGSAVVTLDRTLPSLCAKKRLRDGARVRLVSPRAVSLGPRSGAVPAPTGAWLLDANVDPVAARSLDLARRIAVPVIAAALAALLAASFGLLQL
jgi:hypothetical protein